MNKWIYRGLAGAGVVAVAVVLVFVARGSAYPLTVTDPIMGADQAPVIIEEFADFQCPACKAVSAGVKEVLKAYPTQVQFVYRDFPISGHQHARLMAAGGLCAAQQGKFAEFYDNIFATQTDWAELSAAAAATHLVGIAQENGLNIDEFNACRKSYTVKNEVNADFKEGMSRSVDSTPTFFIDGEKQEGALTVFQFIQKINAALQKKGIEPENKT